jgi:hypothetical protein
MIDIIEIIKSFKVIKKKYYLIEKIFFSKTFKKNDEQSIDRLYRSVHYWYDCWLTERRTAETGRRPTDWVQKSSRSVRNLWLFSRQLLDKMLVPGNE